MKESELLRQARDWLTPERWRRGELVSWPVGAPEPSGACAVGALILVAYEPQSAKELTRRAYVNFPVRTTTPSLTVAAWQLFECTVWEVNDRFGYAAVMRVYGYAIELAEASEAKQGRTTPRAPDPTPASSISGSRTGTPSRELVPA